MRNYIKIGVAGPVGAGKTALIEKLTREIASRYSVAVITNDIYTQEDAEFSAGDKMTLSLCMKSLSDVGRQIVVLHAVSGLKHREIAALLKMPLPTVLSNYNRAIKKLQNAWEKGVQ